MLPWYKKKRYIAILGLVGVFAVSSLGSGATSPVPPSNTEVYNPIPVAVQPVVNQTSSLKRKVAPEQKSTVTSETNAGLSNDNYYTNTSGIKVHSPAYSKSVPEGASAQCRDGTYSFSQSSRGTCSHHGGVAKWL